MEGTLLVVLLAIAVGVAILVHEVTSVDRVLRRRARHDYNTARGTQHRKQLEHCLQALHSRRDKTRREQVNLQRQMASLQGKRRIELERALIEQVVRSQLGTIRGIGPSLETAIIRECFNGSLSSLHRAYTVRGIGPDRQAAISAWVRSVEREIPELLERDFPGKADILARHQSEQTGIEERLANMGEELTRLETMEQAARAGIARLARITPADFAVALKERTAEQNPAIAEHLKGLFAEWEQVPAWYADLLKEVDR